MSKILLSIKYTGEITCDDISAILNDQLVSFTISDNIITITTNDTFGFYLLKITTHTSNRFKIDKVLINGCDIRKLLFLSWVETVDGEKIQPATECWESGQTWILPFGNPLSHWITLAEEKIINGAYGKNLNDDYWFFYPKATTLSNYEFPKVVNDFFQYNFDFTLVNKSNYTLSQIPYMKYNKPISKELLSSIEAEIHDQIDYIRENKSAYGQHNLNKEEFGNKLDNREWYLLWLTHQIADESTKLKQLDYLAHFPSIQKLLVDLDKKYWSIFIGVLPPGGFIYPHSDDTHNMRDNYSDFRGCTALYIPIKWETGNYIKFANAGIPDLDVGPMVVNTDNFTHSVVNQSDQDRYVLVICCDKSIAKDCVISSTY